LQVVAGLLDFGCQQPRQRRVVELDNREQLGLHAAGAVCGLGADHLLAGDAEHVAGPHHVQCRVGLRGGGGAGRGDRQFGRELRPVECVLDGGGVDRGAGAAARPGEEVQGDHAVEVSVVAVWSSDL
jgi:hypothetical protein